MTNKTKHGTSPISSSRADRRVFLFLCITCGVIAILYIALAWQANPGNLLMPLDDTYIHFQYARQMAAGDPYVYNPGDAPTSGATSFLYSPLLATGYLIGFQDLSLAYWAVGLGGLCWLLSAWLIYRLLREAGASLWLSSLIMLHFVLTGAFVFAALSGMETSLFIMAVLLALYAYQQRWQGAAGAAAVLVTLTRPEGAVIGLSLMGAIALRERRLYRWMIFPVLAVFVQPGVNWLMTGSATASGNLAKSHLYNVTAPLPDRLWACVETWLKLWRELLFNDAPAFYVIAPITWLALAWIFYETRRSWQTRTLTIGLLAGFWLIGLSGVIATLDTAFWQYKRYQLPMIALFFPLMGWLLLRLPRQRWIAIGMALLLIFPFRSLIQYATYYHDNIVILRDQQMAMAQWVDQNLPADARIGVHDVGVMRYVGKRATYDVVGLTTPDAALAWRQGSGAIYETLLHHPDRPDYFAIYPNIASLPYLVDAGVLGEVLARFEVPLKENMVVSASPIQIVTAAEWGNPDAGEWQPPAYTDGFTLLKTLNIADTASEGEFDYHWWNADPATGFATEVQRLRDNNCDTAECWHVQGLRVINGGERFLLPDHDQPDYLVIGIYHGAVPATLRVGCNGNQQTYVIPAVPGYWVAVPFLTQTREFCIEAAGQYYPAAYMIYSGDYQLDAAPAEYQAIFTYSGQPEQAVQLISAETQLSDQMLRVDTVWWTGVDLTHDGKFFLHLSADPSQPPAAQVDMMSIPPANWLPGTYRETLSLPLAGIAPGTYQLLLGIYDPVTGTRYTQGEMDHLILGEITIP